MYVRDASDFVNVNRSGGEQNEAGGTGGFLYVEDSVVLGSELDMDDTRAPSGAAVAITRGGYVELSAGVIAGTSASGMHAWRGLQDGGTIWPEASGFLADDVAWGPYGVDLRVCQLSNCADYNLTDETWIECTTGTASPPECELDPTNL